MRVQKSGCGPTESEEWSTDRGIARGVAAGPYLGFSANKIEVEQYKIRGSETISRNIHE